MKKLQNDTVELSLVKWLKPYLAVRTNNKKNLHQYIEVMVEISELVVCQRSHPVFKKVLNEIFWFQPQKSTFFQIFWRLLCTCTLKNFSLSLFLSIEIVFCQFSVIPEFTQVVFKTIMATTALLDSDLVVSVMR